MKVMCFYLIHLSAALASHHVHAWDGCRVQLRDMAAA